MHGILALSDNLELTRDGATGRQLSNLLNAVVHFLTRMGQTYTYSPE
jgi:hypothetical protein